MSGRHEPPTKRSFYFSLATSTLRFAIIVALVVGGVVLINKAFLGQRGALPVGPGPTVSPTPKPTKSPKATPSPQVKGVVIGVFNGTTVTGLAATTASTLQTKFGSVPKQVADAPQKPIVTTTLYYRAPEDRVEAVYLAQHFFKGLGLKVNVVKLPSNATNVNANVRVAIYLGNDYAATQH